MKTVSEKQNSAGVGRLLMPELYGLLSAFIAAVLLLVLFSAVMAAKDIPSSLITPFACISISIGAFFGGMIASKSIHSHGLMMGAVNGVLFFLFLYVIGLIMRQVDLNTMLLLKIILSVVFGAVGGVLGVNVKHKRSKR